MNNGTDIRVRFAPSPTGRLHIGGARTALFNYLFARSMKGAFLLRIEDTDTVRSDPAMTAVILSGLKWLGLGWDEPETYQSAGRQRQADLCRELVERKRAYYCFCTAREIEERRKAAPDRTAYLYDGTCRHLSAEEISRNLHAGEPCTVRFYTPAGETVFTDRVCGEIRIDNREIGDFIILRSDGTPVYQIAVVSDDHGMGITHVIRGDDHLSNTPKQILLYQALGWPQPEFAHVPLILGPDKKRLSKRHGAASVEEFERAGCLPEAVLNYLALLGWSPGQDREIMGLEDMSALFSLERISRNPAVFDESKLIWMNSRYIQEADPAYIWQAVKDAADPAVLSAQALREIDTDRALEITALLQPRLKTVTDFFEQAAFFFQAPRQYEEKAVEKHWHKPGVPARMTKTLAALREVTVWREDILEAEIRRLAADEDTGAGSYIHPLRLALTGAGSSPGLFEVMAILGKEEVVSRLQKAAALLKAERGEE